MSLVVQVTFTSPAPGAGSTGSDTATVKSAVVAAAYVDGSTITSGATVVTPTLVDSVVNPELAEAVSSTAQVTVVEAAGCPDTDLTSTTCAPLAPKVSVDGTIANDAASEAPGAQSTTTALAECGHVDDSVAVSVLASGYDSADEGVSASDGTSSSTVTGSSRS